MSVHFDKDRNQNENLVSGVPDFSLILGGPLYQILRRAHLSDDTLGLLRRRMIVIPLLAWLPMLICSLFIDQAFHTSVDVTFLKDIENHARYLIALPLLIYAELLVNTRLRPMIFQFQERKLVLEPLKLEAAVRSALRLRNSVIAELLLLTLVYTAGIFWRNQIALETSTWYAVVKDGKSELTWTGMWYAYVSLPLFQFIFLRWYFRVFIWARFLWHIAGTKLSLIPTHPDRVGGLGFLGNIPYAFAPILLAHGVLLSGMIANRIFFVGAKLPEFKIEIFVMVMWLLVLVLSPLVVFIRQLNEAKRTGLREYGVLANRYVREFDQKWIRNPSDESFIGSADIQSLADLSNSFQVIREMRLVPFTKDTIFQLSMMTLIPLLPLVLTMFSVEQLLDRLLKTVF